MPFADFNRGLMTIKEKKRLEVFWETREITTISFRQNRAAAVFCPSCQTETLHLTVAEAAAVLKFSDLAVFRFIETSRIHSIETAAGRLLVCGNSLNNKNK